MAVRSSMRVKSLLGWLILSILICLPAAASAAVAQAGVRAERGDKVVVYHFHPTIHCNTCLRVQALTAEALQQSFPGLLDSGVLQWRPINVELPENQHFIAEYRIEPDEVVVVRFRNGKRLAWEKVSRLHDLIHQKPEFMSHVRKSVEKMLGRSMELVSVKEGGG